MNTEKQIDAAYLRLSTLDTGFIHSINAYGHFKDSVSINELSVSQATEVNRHLEEINRRMCKMNEYLIGIAKESVSKLATPKIILTGEVK